MQALSELAKVSEIHTKALKKHQELPERTKKAMEKLIKITNLQKKKEIESKEKQRRQRDEYLEYMRKLNKYRAKRELGEEDEKIKVVNLTTEKQRKAEISKQVIYREKREKFTIHGLRMLEARKRLEKINTEDVICILAIFRNIIETSYCREKLRKNSKWKS